MLTNTHAIPIKIEVTVMVVLSNGFGPSKSITVPGGGGIEGILLNSAGVSLANLSAIIDGDQR